MNMAALFLVALLDVAAPAWALNKCTDAAGKVTYQDRPCPTTGVKIDARPNSVDGAPNPEVARRLDELNRKIDARRKDEDAERAAHGQRVYAYRAQCQAYADEVERQSAWLYALSGAVRASAQAGVDSATRRFNDAGCGNAASYQ
jgi:hypothetical protein